MNYARLSTEILLLSSSDYDALLVRVLETVIGSRCLEDYHVLVIVKVEDKALSSSIELVAVPPLFTTISSEDPVLMVLNQDDCIVSVFEVVVKCLHANSILRDVEEQPPFSHSYNAWKEVSDQLPA